MCLRPGTMWDVPKSRVNELGFVAVSLGLCEAVLDPEAKGKLGNDDSIFI